MTLVPREEFCVRSVCIASCYIVGVDRFFFGEGADIDKRWVMDATCWGTTYMSSPRRTLGHAVL